MYKYFQHISVLFMLVFSNPLMASISVFACEPEWASLADELGGNRIRSFSATTAYQDPHHIEARPSLIAKLRGADLLVCSGAELEAGWLPVLIRQAANNKVLPDMPGYFEASTMVSLLDKPIKIDRSMGDVHASGNPHVHLDPRRIEVIAKSLQARLVAIDPHGADYYQHRYQDFKQRWQKAMSQWLIQASELNGSRIVVHHRDWVYLFEWLGIEIAGALEPKPGLPATAGHMTMLKQTLSLKPAKMIVHTVYQNPRAAQRLANLTNTPVVELPYTVGGTEEVKNLFDLFTVTIEKLKGGAE